MNLYKQPLWNWVYIDLYDANMNFKSQRFSKGLGVLNLQRQPNQTSYLCVRRQNLTPPASLEGPELLTLAWAFSICLHTPRDFGLPVGTSGALFSYFQDLSNWISLQH